MKNIRLITNLLSTFCYHFYYLKQPVKQHRIFFLNTIANFKPDKPDQGIIVSFCTWIIIELTDLKVY